MFSSPERTVLEYRYDSELLRIEAWGPHALRVRATREAALPAEDWALTEPVPAPSSGDVCVTIVPASGDGEGRRPESASLRNGAITARLTHRGKLTITQTGDGEEEEEKVLLEELVRQRYDATDPRCSALRLDAREFRPRPGTRSWRLTARFESLDPDERIYGMGQYQQPNLDLKGCDLELAQRNSQCSVPFAVSSRGYGFLWNNPGVGRAVFGRNGTTFEARATRALDYWVVCGDGGPRALLRAYAAATGRPPPMPEHGLGFWQCKLRYQTQHELLQVAREHKLRRGLPMDVIVVDYFHWPKEGEWKFDPTFWPDPDAMIAELKSMNIELMVSIWPTVDRRSENYAEMVEQGHLIRQDRGWRIAMEGEGNSVHFDATSAAARSYVWSRARAHYHGRGVRAFWLDEAEPEYTHYDFDNYRYAAGPALEVGNVYPREYARAFWEGMVASSSSSTTTPSSPGIVNLVRCCWCGSQKYGVVLWSGDVASSWVSLRAQLSAGLSAGLSGLPWWTTDIGGFHGGDPRQPAFRELFARWFQWGAFCPVFRLHGDREPKQPRHGTTGGSHCLSGAPNEVWSYGDQVYGICRTYLFLREKLRGYVRGLMEEAHAHGDPVMRPMFYEFPEEERMWSIDDQYMFGSQYLVAPILVAGQRERTVVLPKDAKWQKFSAEGELEGEILEGGQVVTVAAPLEYMPVFKKQ
ncbi:glycoside hydrolase family 31 protein [Biscogniauxia sp. FL1348]|nr:glycoside hydrolase family 31 protein [Biscogniauxia sp. FL1348]